MFSCEELSLPCWSRSTCSCFEGTQQKLSILMRIILQFQFYRAVNCEYFYTLPFSTQPRICPFA
ncbi:hypothetical protein AKJ16_DCAP16857 [Drosera capensis]